MRQLTQEQFERLKPYRDHLTRGLYGRYVYLLTRPIYNELSNVYRELGYTQRLDYTCNSCLLQLTTTLGRLFFEFEAELMEADQNKLTEDDDEENPDFTEEDLEKAADEINEAIIKDIVESHKEPVTATKTNNTKAKKTNTRKKK